MRCQDFEGGAFQRGGALPLQLQDMRRGEGRGGGDERLQVLVLVQVVLPGGNPRKPWMIEGYMWRVSRFQHVAAVGRHDWWVPVGIGGDVGPGVEELGRADAVAEAVIDGGAEDHASAAETGHLEARNGRANRVNK